MVTFVVKADTAEDMQKQIAQWLMREATDRSARGRIATTKRQMHDLDAEYRALKAAALFIEGLTIEPKTIRRCKDCGSVDIGTELIYNDT